MLLRLLMLVMLLLPNAAGAATYWEDTFEDGILSDTWDLSECGASPPAAGCNAAISSDFAFSGTKSLKSTYHPTCTTCQQGTFYDRFFPASEEVWTRQYVRTTAFTYEASAGSKYYYLHNPSMGYPNFVLLNHNGSRQMGFTVQGEASLCANGQGPYDTCDYPPNMAAVNLADNQWYCIEAHAKMNTAGQPDGLIELFVDGTQTLGYYNRTFRGPNATNGPENNNYGAATINAIRHYTQYGAGNRYTDDLAVGTTRIGCSGAPPPPIDTTAPSPPSAPTLTVSGGGQISLSWTNGTDAVGVTGTNILRCSGAACSPVTILTVVNNGSTVSYADTGLTAGTTYGYKLSNFDAAGNQSAFSAVAYAATTSTFRTQTLSDFFNRADSTELGTSWDAGYTSFFGANTNLAIVNNQLRVATLAADSLETNNTAVANDQWAQITFASLTAADADIKAPGLLLRANAPGNLTGYACRVWIYNGSPHARIERWDALVAHVPLVDESATVWLTGDKLRCESEGTTLRLYQIRGAVETLVLSTTDATYASGRTGLIHFVQAGTTGDIQIDDFLAGEFAVSAPASPTIVSVTGGSRTSTTVTWTGSPATIRIATEFGSVVEPLSSFPSGVYTFPVNVLATMTDWFCAFARDAQGNENTTPSAYQCGAVPYAPDTAPVVLSNPLPSASLPNGTTTTQIIATVDKTAGVSCRYDTTDIAYSAMQTTSVVTLVGFSAQATVTGLATGDNLFYMCCNFTDLLGVDHVNTTNLLFTVNVAASTPDVTPPSTVTNLVANVLSNSQVELAWTVATDDVAVDGYNVYLSVGTGNTTYLLETQVVNATRVVVNLQQNAVHNFVVKARDTSQNLSAAYSNVATVTTQTIPDVTPPSTMSNLRAVGVYKNSVILQWDSGTDDRGAVTTTIERCTGAACSDFAVIVSNLALQQLIVALSPSTTYSFRGKHSDTANNPSVEYSNVVTITTNATGLPQPRLPVPYSQPRLPRN